MGEENGLGMNKSRRWGDGMVFAGDGDDVVQGGSGKDYLDGGDDTLLGGTGDDILEGDASTVAQANHGDDWLDGEEGNDKLQGDGKKCRRWNDGMLAAWAGRNPNVGAGATANDGIWRCVA